MRVKGVQNASAVSHGVFELKRVTATRELCAFYRIELKFRMVAIGCGFTGLNGKRKTSRHHRRGCGPFVRRWPGARIKINTSATAASS